jgi:LPXTG-motif cell wall-anchored protein
MEENNMGKKELPKTGGGDSASLLGLGVGTLLTGGGLLVRKIVRWGPIIIHQAVLRKGFRPPLATKNLSRSLWGQAVRRAPFRSQLMA